jgi:hypothetical protein
VTLANVGLIPGIATKGDLLVVDRQSHDTIHQAAKSAAADGAILEEVHPLGAESLARILEKSSAKTRVVAVDGALGRALDRRPLSQGVGKGKAHLDEVGAGGGQALHEPQRLTPPVQRGQLVQQGWAHVRWRGGELVEQLGDLGFDLIEGHGGLHHRMNR